MFLYFTYLRNILREKNIEKLVIYIRIYLFICVLWFEIYSTYFINPVLIYIYRKEIAILHNKYFPSLELKVRVEVTDRVSLDSEWI